MFILVSQVEGVKCLKVWVFGRVQKALQFDAPLEVPL